MTQPYAGTTFDAALDLTRLNAQTRRVAECMADGAWRTLRELSDAANAPEASVSARLRDLRKPRNGGHTVERRRRPGWAATSGLWEYRLVVATEEDAGPEPAPALRCAICSSPNTDAEGYCAYHARRY